MDTTTDTPERAAAARPAAAPAPTPRELAQPMLPMWAQRDPRRGRTSTIRRETEAGLCEDWGPTGWSATAIPWHFTHEQALAIVALLQNQRG